MAITDPVRPKGVVLHVPAGQLHVAPQLFIRLICGTPPMSQRYPQERSSRDASDRFLKPYERERASTMDSRIPVSDAFAFAIQVQRLIRLPEHRAPRRQSGRCGYIKSARARTFYPRVKQIQGSSFQWRHVLTNKVF